MRIAMIGLGALGGIYLDRLTRGKPDLDVTVVADGERADRLRDGILLNGERRLWPVNTAGAADVVIVATKADGLAPAIDLARPYVRPGTIVVSLINGIHSEGVLAEAFPEASVVPAMTAGSDVVRRGSEIRFANFGRITFGDDAQPDAVAALAALFAEAGVPHVVPADMPHAMWWKFMGNCGINTTSALLDAEYGAFQGEGRPARELMILACREVIALANARGIALGDDDLAEWTAVVDTLDPSGETSMLQDMRAARPTEIDIFSGEVVRIGRESGVATPVAEALLLAIRAREQLVTA
ncbi:ketopantoate reductase family protein [Microbacterium indicum]|uniref:ketopantoate reductase family protein n=1 Tax=Microbacterium indicum TaxID=358100 RepID=UPI00041CC614|nr:ketopantoate reductase family protein [Microbacterium indicum]